MKFHRTKQDTLQVLVCAPHLCFGSATGVLELPEGSLGVLMFGTFLSNSSGEITEEELLRRLQHIKEGPPQQSNEDSRGI